MDVWYNTICGDVVKAFLFEVIYLDALDPIIIKLLEYTYVYL